MKYRVQQPATVIAANGPIDSHRIACHTLFFAHAVFYLQANVGFLS
jgi:hypothetical protein